MDDEDELRTNAPSSTSDEESADPDGVDRARDASGSPAPRRLEPPRPWLTQSANGTSAADDVAPESPPVESPSGPAADASKDGGSSRLQPIRPWLKQAPREPVAKAAPRGAGDRSHVLDPSRPWRDQPAAPTPRPTASPTPSNAAAVLEPLAEAVAEASAVPDERADESAQDGRWERRRVVPDNEPARHAALPGQPSWPIAFESPELADAASELLRGRDTGPSPVIAGSNDPPDIRPVGRLRKATRWLFEQAPVRDEPLAAPAASAATIAGATPPFDATSAAEDRDGWTADELRALAPEPTPEPAAEAVEPAGSVPESVEAPVSATRSDLIRRLSAPSPDGANAIEPVVVPMPATIPMRPTIAWDEIAPPVPDAVIEPVPEPVGDPAVGETVAEAVETPSEGVAALPALIGDEPVPAANPVPEVETATAVSAPPVPPAPVVRPRPRPRPFAGAGIDDERPGAQSAPPRVTPSIAAASAPSSLTRARAAETDDFFTRPDDDEPPTGPKQTLAKGGPPGGRKSMRRLIRTGAILVIAVLAATLLRVFVVAPYYIPSASMEPTLHGCPGCNNDHVLVDKLSYRMHDIHRGDIVVFHRPATWQVPEGTLIKRVIGLPGDRLKVSDGKLFVNGLVLEESYTNPACPAGSSGSGNLAPGKTYGPVPDGDVFVMGDNRCDSSDSRVFGPVPDSKVIGRAFVIIWPLGRLHSL